MKKFLSIALVAIMLCTVALAAAPTVAEFSANNGFYLYSGSKETGDLTKTDVQDVPTIADTAKGLQVVHGGYYASGDNCGGVVSKEKYDLNGFSATVYFEKAPEVTTATDCWVAMDFLAAPKAFFTGNFDVDNGGNQGIMDLIRFGKTYIEAYEGVSGFSQTYNSQAEEASVNDMFKIVSDMSLTVSVARNDDFTYSLTFSRDGYEDFTVPYAWNVGDVFADGKAYFSVIASCEIAGDDAWTYYITDITNGVALTQEEIDARIAEKEAAELAANIDAATKEADKVAEKVAEQTAEAEACGDAIALEKAAAAQAALDEAYAAIEAHDFETAAAKSEEADTLAQEVKHAVKAAAPEEKEEAPVVDDTPATDATTDAPAADTAEEGGSPIGWIVAAIIVIVIIVVIVVVSKKKKK